MTDLEALGTPAPDSLKSGVGIGGSGRPDVGGGRCRAADHGGGRCGTLDVRSGLWTRLKGAAHSKDSTHAYAGGALVDVTDPDTFEVVKPGDSEISFLCNGPNSELRDKTAMPTSMWGWARDNKAYYHADCRVKKADRDTFEVLNSHYAKDKDRVYCVMTGKSFRSLVPTPIASKPQPSSQRRDEIEIMNSS